MPPCSHPDLTGHILPLFDLARQWPKLRDGVLDTVERVAAKGSFSLGEELQAFESEYAGFCGSAHCVGVANGTAAIELALRAVGVAPGTDVITVSHTFVATVKRFGPSAPGRSSSTLIRILVAWIQPHSAVP